MKFTSQKTVIFGSAWLCLIIAMLLSSGCANKKTTVERGLKKHAGELHSNRYSKINTIQATRVVSVVEQDSMVYRHKPDQTKYYYYPPAFPKPAMTEQQAFNSGGVLGYLIVNGVEGHIDDLDEEATKPVLNAISIDIRRVIGDALKDATFSSDWLKADQFDERKERLFKEEVTSSMMSNFKSRLVMSTIYKLSGDDYEMLEINSFLSLFVDNEKKPMYTASYVYFSSPIYADNESEVIAKWVSNNGEKINRAFIEGMENISQMIKMDLNSLTVGGKLEREKKLLVLKNVVFGSSFGHRFREGRVVQRENGRLILQAKNRTLISAKEINPEIAKSSK